MKNTKRQFDYLQRIIQTQALLGQADLDIETFMQMVVDAMQDLTDARGAVVELVDQEDMVYRAVTGVLSEFVGLRLPLANSLSGLCVSSGEVLHCDDALTDPRVNAEACQRVGVRSMICTPLFQNGVPVGALKVMSEKPSGFDEDDVQALNLMGGALGAALAKQVIFEEMVRIQGQLRLNEERMRTILQSANDAVISINQTGTVTQWNRAAEKLFAWTSSEALGRSVADLIVPKSMRDSFDDILKNVQRYSEIEQQVRRELIAVDRYGKELTVEVSINLSNTAKDVEFTAFLHDISERKRLEAALRDLALSDGLTGLPNRRSFMDSLNKSMARQQRQSYGMALFFMDLNDFKEINDTHGHHVGDQVLKEFSHRVLGCLRQTDIFARLGGDEFVLLLEGVLSENQAQAVASKIITTLRAPLPTTSIWMSTSIGIRLYEKGISETQFLHDADVAMYQAKQSEGKGSSIAIFGG